MKTVSVPAAAPVLQPPPAALKLMSDERLARWAAKGSQAAFAVIFERHHQALHRYCHSIVGNGHDAADALQSTMLKALRALPGETRTIALKPWLYRIAHNESISLLRARRPDSTLDAAAHLGDPVADSIVQSRERLRELTADLRELTERQRGALLMRELGGLQFSDVADALAVTPTAAKQSVYEARCALQALQEGRAMDCELVRRTLSDGDRRTLRAMKLRGHLRACAGCRDFEAALRHRPAQLAALAPPLPLAAAASILHGLLGGGAGHGGGGLLAGLGAGAKTGGALSLGAAKVATVAVIAGSAAGGAIHVTPDGPPQRSDSGSLPSRAAPAASRPGPPLATRDRQASRRAHGAAPSTDRAAASTREAAATAAADDGAAGAGGAQRPVAGSAPAAAGISRPPQPAVTPAPAGGREAVADARPGRDRGSPAATQMRPAPAATSAPARPAATSSAPLPAAAPVPSTASAAAGAAVSATPAAPVASAVDRADALTAPRSR